MSARTYAPRDRRRQRAGRADYGTLHLGTATSFTVGGVPDGTFWLRLRGTCGVGPASNERPLIAGGTAADSRRCAGARS